MSFAESIWDSPVSPDLIQGLNSIRARWRGIGNARQAAIRLGIDQSIRARPFDTAIHFINSAMRAWVAAESSVVLRAMASMSSPLAPSIMRLRVDAACWNSGSFSMA